jgi:uracil-DNA glycosylase family 4
MADEKIENIIDSLEDYLDNAKRFNRNKLFVERESANKNLNDKSEELLTQNTENRQVDTNKKSEKRPAVEVDLFGNVVKSKEDWEFAETLEELNSLICNCQKCVLGATRTKFVFGVGNPKADIVLIGEAPGADEDAKGEPFVGRAGQLLNKILEATGFKREEVFICNILKCRPPGNRNPVPEEVEKCRPYLEYQLKLLNPKLILLLGRVAAESLLKTREPLNKLRGKVHDYKGYKVMITFHPAALLRNPNWKRPTWDDMKQFKTLYEELKKGKK